MFEEVLISTGLVGLFAVRGFIPAFFIALTLRFGPELGLNPALASDLQDAAGSMGVAPSWFTSNPALLILGLLACMELGANKHPELRELLAMIDRYFKPAMAGLTYLGVMSTSDSAFVESTYQAVPEGAGVFSMMLLAGVIVSTWVGAGLKNAALGVLTDLDPDDSFGLMRAISFLGDAWVIVGAILLVMIPLLVAIIVFVMFGIISYLRRRAHIRDEAMKRACVSCDQRVYACAPSCPSCQAEQTNVQDVGWLGSCADRPAHMENHAEHLLAVGRCPRCATKLTKNDVDDGCSVCAFNPFLDKATISKFDRYMHLRLVSTLIVCSLIGLVPILGFAVAIVIYKLQLVGPYRRFIGRGSGIMARWGLRALLLIAIFLQIIPGLNAIVVAAMTFLSYWVYRGLFFKRVRSMQPIAVIAEDAPPITEA